MKITRRQLRRIIREAFWDEISHDEVVQYLTDRANAYHEDAKADRNLTPAAIERLLLDDFMDDLGHDVDISMYTELITNLASGGSRGLGI